MKHELRLINIQQFSSYLTGNTQSVHRNNNPDHNATTIVTLYSESHTKPVTTLCIHNVDISMLQYKITAMIFVVDGLLF